MPATMDDESPRFVLGIRRTWVLWILPVVGLLLVVLIVAMSLRWIPYIFTDDMDAWAVAATAILVFIALIEALLMLRRRPKRQAPEPVEEAPASQVASDIELRATSESKEGKRVVEASLPPKSLYAGGIYAKTYVPVSSDVVLRVEDLIAFPGEA